MKLCTPTRNNLALLCSSLRILPGYRYQSNTTNSRNQPTPSGDGWTEISIPMPWGQIAGKTYGDPKGFPVLAVHGMLDNCGTFDRLIPLLSKSLYFVAIDLPGHGLSSHLPPGAPYHFLDIAITMRRITNHLQWTKFSWLGHSYGGGLGAIFSATFPSHVSQATQAELPGWSRDPNKKEAESTPGNSSVSVSPNTPEFSQPLVDRLVMIDLIISPTGVIGVGDNYEKKLSIEIDQFLAKEKKNSDLKSPPAYDKKEAMARLIKGTGNALTPDTASILMKRGTKLTEDNKYTFSRDIRHANAPIIGLTDETASQILHQLKTDILFIKAKNSSWFWEKKYAQQVLGIYKKACPTYQYEEIEGNHFLHLIEPERIAGLINKFLLRES